MNEGLAVMAASAVGSFVGCVVGLYLGTQIMIKAVKDAFGPK